jgi:hypothetical protein
MMRQPILETGFGLLDGVLGRPIKPMTERDIRMDQPDLHRIFMEWSRGEQIKHAEAEEAALAQQLYSMLEEEYASYLLLKDTKSDNKLRQYTVSCKAFIKACNELHASSRPARPALSRHFSTLRKRAALGRV